MTNNASRAIRRETIISIVINVLISAFFFMLFFGLQAPAPVRGLGGYAFDFLPQSFMVALMGSLVPGLLTASRAKTLARLTYLNRRAASAIVLRSVLTAIGAALLVGGATAAILFLVGLLTVDPLPGLIGKMAFGGTLALFVTPGAVRFALAGSARPESA